MNKDIGKIINILHRRGQHKFAKMLKKSRGTLNESSTYGTMAFSNLSTYEFYQPLDETESLKKITKSQKHELIEVLHLLYPVKANEPEINSVEFYVDPERPYDIEVIDAGELESMDFDYINEQISKCRDKLNSEDYEGAVTNARTLIESVCLTIVESVKNNFKYDGNLIKLYKITNEILILNPKDYDDQNLKQILSGMFSLINGIAGLRNSISDSHGKSPKSRYRIDKRHALLAVNISKTASEYLFLTWEKKIDNEKRQNDFGT